jgi:hypothetical protein
LMMAKSTAITRTQIASRASVAIVDGQLVTFPVSGGVNIPTNTQFNTLIVDIVLSDADKLAAGKTLQLNSFYSADAGANWQFINGFSWNSYGPGGLTVTDPDGTVHVNPDPMLYVPLGNAKGNIVRIQYQANGLTNAGVVVFGVS